MNRALSCAVTGAHVNGALAVVVRLLQWPALRVTTDAAVMDTGGRAARGTAPESGVWTSGRTNAEDSIT